MADRETNNDDPTRMFVDLVFEGGGVKGIGLSGAYSVLIERGYKPQNVAGSSAGAIMAVLVAAGYTADEVRDAIFHLDFRRFMDRSWIDRVPLVGAPWSILKDRGIYEGKALLGHLRELLQAKNVRTFGDLVHPDHANDDNPLYHHKAQVIVSDLTDRRLLVLPRDAGVLGVEPNELEVALAARMSLSIPVFFEPVPYRNPKTGQQHLVVDGGTFSNYPVWLFDSQGNPSWPTFGLKLVEPEPKKSIGESLREESPPRGVKGVVEYARLLIQTAMKFHDRLYIEEAQFARTIPIETLGVGTTEFDISDERKERLFQSGRKAATEFLASWDFEGYKAKYRRGPEPDRTQEVAAQMAAAAPA